MEQRYPNTKCERCEKPIYRRPSDIERYKNGVFCGRECFHLHVWGNTPSSSKAICEECGCQFTRTHNSRKAKYCSRACSNKGRRVITYQGLGRLNSSQRKLIEIKQKHDIKHCMIEKCKYGRTLDVHRLVPGHKGGIYEIGNMYAICPNHHAEFTRGIIELIKINDSVLRAVDK